VPRTSASDGPGDGFAGLATEPDAPLTAVHRTLRTELDAAQRRCGERPVRVLDVGGGSGTWAVPMAALGCQVTVVDTSPNALAALRRRAGEAGVGARVTAVQGDVQVLAEVLAGADAGAGADLVLGHGLLEVVDDVGVAVTQLAQATAPGGAVSVLTAGRHGAALAQAHAGRVAQARAVLVDPTGRVGEHDPAQRRLSLAALCGLLESVGGLTVEQAQGDGMFEGWLPSSVRSDDPDGVAELELIMSGTPELLVLAARLHVLARQPDSSSFGGSPEQ
jgi:2-polyprenyl-3-methyl-5-hydroxy-6-metoxy-1,4-benzoquinol methylase